MFYKIQQLWQYPSSTTDVPEQYTYTKSSMVHIIASTVGSSMGFYRQLQTTTKKITKLCLAHQLLDFIPPIPQATLDRDNAEPFTSPTTQQGLQTSLLPNLQLMYYTQDRTWTWSSLGVFFWIRKS